MNITVAVITEQLSQHLQPLKEKEGYLKFQNQLSFLQLDVETCKITKNVVFLIFEYRINKNALTAGPVELAWRLHREMRRRLILHETGFTRERFLTSFFIDVEYSSGYLLFICSWTDLVRVLATTGNASAVAGCTRV